MSWLQGLGAAGQGLTAGLKDLREMQEAEQIKQLRQQQIDQLNRQATFQKELSEAANYDPYQERQTAADGARAQRILDTGEEIAPVQVRRSPLDDVRKYNRLQEIAMRNGQVETALRFGKEARDLHDRAVVDVAKRAYTGLAAGNVDALHDAYDNFFNDGFQMRGGINYVEVPATDLYGRPVVGQDGKPQTRQVAVYNGERFDPATGKAVEKLENVPLAQLQQTVLGMTSPNGLMELYKINTGASTAQDKLLNAFIMKMMGEQGATDRTLIRGGGAGGSGSGSGSGRGNTDAIYQTVKDLVPSDAPNRAQILGNARSIINNNPGIPQNEGRVVDVASRIADGKLTPQVYVDGSGRMNYGVQYQGDYFKLRDGFDFEKMSKSSDITADAGLNMRKQAQAAITNYFVGNPNAGELVNELAGKDLKSLSKDERTALTQRFRSMGWGGDLGMVQQAARDAKRQLEATEEKPARGIENDANKVDPNSAAGRFQARQQQAKSDRAEKASQLQVRAIEALRGDDLSAVSDIQSDPLFSALPNDLKVQIFNRVRGTGGYRGIRP